MKFTINSKVFLARLAAAGKAVNSKTTISILGNFLIVLKGKTVTITASDCENVVVSRIEATEAEGEGGVCIDAKRITEILKAIPDCPVVFEIDTVNLSVVVRYRNGKYNLTGLPDKDYPAYETDNTQVEGRIKIPSSLLLKAMDKVGFAASTDEFHPMLNGVLWDITEEAITYVATDTRVMAKYRSTQVAPGQVMKFTLPNKAGSLVRSLIGKQEDVEVVVSEKFVSFTGKDFKLRSILPKGRYPDYNRVIPQNQPISIIVDRIDFINAISRVSICADAQMQMLRLTIADGKIKATAQDISFNVSGEEQVDCDYFGTPFEIGFGSSYLRNVLNAVDTQKAVIKLIDYSRPGLFVPAENEEYGELTIICMPMNIQNHN